MKRTFLLVALLLINSLIYAQTSKGKIPFALGVTNNIHSAVLGEQRILNIYLPDGYNNDTATYPVIYLLDGSANEDFIHVCGIVQFLNMIGYMPPTIIVGIANVDRQRDFTFPSNVDYYPIIEKHKKDFPTAGGSAQFLSFLEIELLPYVRKNYRVRSSTLIGQSLGGLVATQILLEKPTLFNTYIIVSPSLWWDNESLLNRAPQLLQQHEAAKAIVYLSTGGAEDDVMQNDAKKLNELLYQQKNLTVLYRPEAKESHLTILHNCLYNAFVALYEKDRK